MNTPIDTRTPERVIPFHFHTHTLRADLTEDGTPIFHAGDLCALLGYKNPRAAIRRHVDQEDVAKRDTLTEGGIQKATWVTEPGLWSLILGSETPQAKAVKRWVCAEVLPAIRRQGYYIAPGAVVGILPLELFRKAWRGKPNAACLGCQLWAKLEIKKRLTDWLAIRLKHFEPGEDFEWWDGDALLPRRTAELIAARSWSEGAQQLRRRWSDNLSDTADLVEGGAV